MSMFLLVFESRSSGCPEELLWRFHGLENPSVVGSSGSTSSVVIESLNCEINENSIRGDPFVSLSQRLRPKFFFPLFASLNRVKLFFFNPQVCHMRMLVNLTVDQKKSQIEKYV